ncbi:MAG: DUF5989 family protein [Lentimonas sp.]
MSPKTEFEKSSAEASNKGLLSEFFGLLMENKKWWLAPIIIIMLLFGVLMLLAGTGAAPFIYSVF